MTPMAEHLLERVSDRELVIRRRFHAPAGLVFRAWTTADLMMRWWVPKSFGIAVLSAEMDVRLGGSYRFVFAHPASPEPMAFFGRYLEYIQDARLVWTNDESPDGAVTTLTLTQRDGATDVMLSDLYPTKEALDAAIESGSTSAYDEQFAALDGLIPDLQG